MKLTSPQRLIYDAEKFIGGSVSVMCGVMTVDRPCPEERVVAAIREIYRTNDALNLRLDETGAEPELYMTDPGEREIPVVRVDDPAALEAIGREAAQTPFDLTGPLSDLRAVTYPGGYGIVLRVHHLLGDAWSMSLIGTQLNDIIEGRSSQRYSITEYAAAEGGYFESRRCERDRAYFMRMFDEIGAPTFLSDRESDDYSAELLRLTLSGGVRRALAAFAEREELSENALLFGIFALYFAKKRGCPEAFYLGMPVLGRVSERELNTVGMFVNTAPVAIRPDYEASLTENLKAVADEILSVFRHQKYNYGLLLRDLRETRGYTGRLYDTIVNYQSDDIFADAEMRATEYVRGRYAETLQLAFSSRGGEEGLTVDYIYKPSKLTEAEVGRIHDELTHLVKTVLETPELPLRELCLVPDLRRFLETVCAGPAAPIPDGSLYELFRAQAEKTPETAAVLCGDVKLTYGELLARVDDTAARLAGLGVKEGDAVAVRLERTELIVALQLAVMKRGGVFVPADKRFPPKRLSYLCEDCGARVIICDDAPLPTLPGTRAVTPAMLAAAPAVDLPAVRRENTYIIFTSGSTGTPKGCMLNRKGLVNFCVNNNTLPALRKRETNVFACVNSASFDYFIAETLLPLTNGYTVALLSEEESLRQDRFLEAAARYGVNVLMTTPTRLALFFDGAADLGALRELDVICTSGEPLPEPLLTKMYAASPKAEIFNPLGPSECSVWDLGGNLDREKGADVHLGRPIANVRAYVLDRFMRPVPVGAEGELCIAGAGVGGGYPGHPELTAERFVKDPFGEGMLYRTGDVVVPREDGNFAYVGRNDTQIKLRGLRIEAAEVEAALCAVDGVELAAVKVQKDGERQVLCAYYTGIEHAPADLRAALAVTLPRYMVPQAFTRLDAMPLTVTGKIDRRALPETDLSKLVKETEYIAPATDAEKLLTEAAARELGAERVGLNDNFFDLGGDSIKAIYLASMLERRGYAVAVPDIMQSETLGSLAEKMIPINRPVHRKKGEAPERCPFPPILSAYLRNAPTDAEGYSQAVILRLDCGEAQLKGALDAVCHRHDMLRAVTEVNGFRIRKAGSSDSYRFRIVPFEGDENAAAAFLKNRTVRFDLKNGPLTDVLFCPRARGGLCRLTIHHFITDLVSWEILLKDLFSALDALKAGRDVRLPEPTLPYTTWMTERASDAPVFPEHSAVSEAKSFPREKTAGEETHKALLARECIGPFFRRESGPKTLRNAILTATGLAAYEWLGGDAVILCESHGRSAEVSGTIGWFTELIPVVFRNPDFANACFTVSEALKKGADPSFDRLLRETGLPASCGILFNFYNNAALEKTLGSRVVCRIAGQSRFPGVIAVDCFLTRNGVELEIFQPAGCAPDGAARTLAGLIPVYLKKLAEADVAFTGARIAGYSDDTLTAEELKELQDLF